jgi:uncharacterized protein with GYD domain
MTKYALFFSYTAEAWSGMIANPNDRSNAVRTILENMGGGLDSMYYMFGDRDGFVIFDAPDSDAAAALALLVTSTGAFRSAETHQLIAPADLLGVLSKANAAKGSYTKPGD